MSIFAIARAVHARRITFLGVGSLLLLVASFGCSRESEGFRGVVISPPPSVRSVELPSAQGAPRSLVPPAGSVQLVYFGYTHCPDVCPTTLASLKRVFAKIGEEKSRRVNLMMFTVDPERDRPKVLREYLDFFNPSWVPVVVDQPSTLRTIADAFGADYAVTKTDDGEVEVSHTGGLYAIDDSGSVAVQWPFDAESGASDVIAHDLSMLLTEKRSVP